MKADIIEMNSTVPDREAIRQWERDEVARAIRENKILKGSSRKRAALNLARMLNDVSAHERGLRTKIVSLAWPNDDVPLKKLDLVTLPLSGDAAQRRLDRLAKKPKHYEKLARAIAQISRRNIGDVCVEAFRGTEIEAGVARRAQAFSTDYPEDWDRLVELIEAMTTSIAKRTGLRDHLSRIATRTGTYRLDRDTIEPSGSCLLPHGSLTNGFEVFEEFPPIPSVLLAAIALVEPFERTLNVQNAEGAKRNLPVIVHIWREVRLAIGPADDTVTPRPMFELRTAVDLIDESNHDWASLRKWFYINGQEDFRAIDQEGTEVAAMVDLGPVPGTEARWVPLLEDGARQYEHVYATWVPVTSLSCAEFLNGSISDRCALVPEISGGRGVATLLPHDTIGSWIEAALTDEDRTLERRLEKESERLVALVQNYIDQTREEASERHRRALSQWVDSATREESQND